MITTDSHRLHAGSWRQVLLLSLWRITVPEGQAHLRRKSGDMIRLQAFQTAAHEGGFVKVSESAEGNVLWLRKSAPDRVTETHQRMCIDSLTNSVTVYWMTAPGKADSKTFRAVAALQEWFKLIPEIIRPR